jgi:hypothetical protein
LHYFEQKLSAINLFEFSNTQHNQEEKIEQARGDRTALDRILVILLSWISGTETPKPKRTGLDVHDCGSNNPA